MRIKDLIKSIVPATYRKIDKSEIRLMKKIDTLTWYQERIFDFACYSEILYEAKDIHEKNFRKYKNYFKGRDIAVIGTGPTLDKWEPFETCIQMGVNSTIFSEKLRLDYLFIQDYNPVTFERIKQALKDEKNSNCKVFAGLHYLSYVKSIPLNEIEAINAEQYFFYDGHKADFFPWDYTLDISAKPFMAYYSIISIPLQFALYTHPKRIYIVGCDCSGGSHYSNDENIFEWPDYYVQNLINGWEKFKDFASRFYPDVDIVSINPVGLKGLFRDMYTEEYLIEHPEINRNEIEIIK